MLTTRIRKQIEWHFYNFNADLALLEDRIADIIDGNMNAECSHVGSRSRAGKPTESKAIRIDALTREKNWSTVVQMTFSAFKFEPEHDVMVELYIERKNRKEIYSADGLWERTFYRWRERWLEYAFKCAQEYKLL